jgi:23S rRNA (pseudouridine1915-N3)-methyltransferase
VRIRIVVVGRPARRLADAIAEYEARAARYWALDVIEVRAERAARNAEPDRVRTAESERLWEKIHDGAETVALTREGEAHSSPAFADWLAERAVSGHPGVAFLLGGALGLSADVIARCSRRLRLSDMTMPHEIARLVLAEQLYRAGTIVRNEPYHKGGA